MGQRYIYIRPAIVQLVFHFDISQERDKSEVRFIPSVIYMVAYLLIVVMRRVSLLIYCFCSADSSVPSFARLAH